MAEEIVNPTPEVQPVEEAKSPEVSQLVQNYESLIKKQQAQFEQLMKQQELTNKVNQQLMNQMNSMTKPQATTSPANNEHWIDKVLREEFDSNSKVEAKFDNLDFHKNTKQVALWWLKYQKDRGISNEEIADRYYRMVKGIETELNTN